MKPIVLMHRNADEEVTGYTSILPESVEVIAEILIAAALMVGRKSSEGASGWDDLSSALDEAETVTGTMADSFAVRP